MKQSVKQHSQMIASKQVTTTEGLHSLDTSVTLTGDTIVVPPVTIIRKFKRQCIACRQYFSKTELLKITKQSCYNPVHYSVSLANSVAVVQRANQQGNIVVLNPSTAFFGRSVYCCSSLACRQKLVEKQGKFLRHRLKLSTALPANQWDLLLESLQQQSVVPASTTLVNQH